MIGSAGVGGYFLGRSTDGSTAEVVPLTDAELAWCTPNEAAMVMTMDGLGYFDDYPSGVEEYEQSYEGADPTEIRKLLEQANYLSTSQGVVVNFGPQGTRMSFDLAVARAVNNAQALFHFWMRAVDASFQVGAFRVHPDVVRVCRAAYEAFR